MAEQKVGHAILCPCCDSAQFYHVDNTLHCPQCSHRWRQADTDKLNQHYTQLVGRNTLPDSYIQTKLVERVAFLSPYLSEGQSILEVGCAEGHLGQRLKALQTLNYYGLELSQDAVLADNLLDKVFRSPNAVTADFRFDLIIGFHVLEHIPDLHQVMVEWKRWLKPSGTMIIEVPNQSGHPWVGNDKNPEHIHQFDAASITALLSRHGFSVKMLHRGLFESPCYPDSLRLVVTHSVSSDQRQKALITAIKNTISEPFDVFAVGGDFRNYLAPVIDKLEIHSLFDKAASGEKIANKMIRTFTYDANQQRPILITSVRYEEQIYAELLQQNIASEKIYRLSDILMQVNVNA